MATKIRIQHEWQVPREVVFAHLFDDELIERVAAALRSAKRRLVAKEEEKDGRILQRYEVKANTEDVPAAARKALPLEAFQWTEESRWDPSAKRFDWKVITQVMSEKIDCSGTAYYETTSSGTRRVVEGQIDIKIPLVGRVAEKIILGKLEASFQDTGRAEGEYFTEMAGKQAG